MSLRFFSIVVIQAKRALASLLWVERINTDHDWRGLASSNTGQYLAAINTRGLFLSSNYGADWVDGSGDLPGGSSAHVWTSIASDKTGSIIVATENAGYIWVSNNRGANWTAEGPRKDWKSASVIAAGGYEAAAIDATDHTVWATPYFDFGLTHWSEQDLGSNDWDRVAVGLFGETALATHGDLLASGYVAITTNGTTWNIVRNGLPNDYWDVITGYDNGFSSKGFVLAAGYSNTVEISTTSGQAWMASSPIGSGYSAWKAIATSIDGGEMILLPDGNSAPQISTDKGLTWSTVSGLPTVDWAAAAVSGDGTFMAAAGYTDVYTTNKGPVYSGVSLQSESATSTTLATLGDTVDVILELPLPPLAAPQVNIQGHGTTTAVEVDTNIWLASTVVLGADHDGPVTFTATFGNNTGTATTTTTSTTDSSSVAIDHTGPVITLNGNATVHVNVGDTYSDPGATASDASDGDVTSSIATTGNVDTAVVGTYAVAYQVSDSLGNSSTATRTVIVSQGGSSSSSSGGSVSNGDLAKLLAPSAAATAYLHSRGGPAITQSAGAAAVSNLPASTTTPAFTMDLSFGMANHEVHLLQNYLNMHGFPVAASGPGSLGNETDRFGSLTLQALKRFQAAHGISSTGNFGPVTRAFVNKR